jgi:serine/threonine protein phosphatase PrpC
MRFDTHCISAAGSREANEDYYDYGVEGGAGCWVLADGLGGHGGGETASRIAVGAVMDAFRHHAKGARDPVETMEEYFRVAAHAILERRLADPALAGMRTTLVILEAREGRAIWAHAGDSRLYFFRNGAIAARTFDHSVPQKLVEGGLMKPSGIRLHPDRNRLLRSVGGDEPVRPSVAESALDLNPGDAFLLASDGLWEFVREIEMEIDLAKSDTPSSWLRLLGRRLRAAALEDHDNYTAVAVFVEGNSAEGGSGHD